MNVAEKQEAISSRTDWNIFDSFCGVTNFSYFEMQHQLVRVIDIAKAEKVTGSQIQLGRYSVYLSPLDGLEGMLQFTAPGKVIDLNIEAVCCKSQALVFHPDLIRGTLLEQCIHEYSFFNYNIDRPLHLSADEYRIALDCLSNIKNELAQIHDRHSKKLIASNIELLLNYCERFYSRQFVTVESSTQSVLQRLDKLLIRYFSSEIPAKLGIPCVAYCADELHLSANYFGSLIKKETGITAQEYIRYKLAEEAKYRIVNFQKTINEIAYEFGFKYPQHFSRFFKKVVGQSPNEYRMVNLN